MKRRTIAHALLTIDRIIERPVNCHFFLHETGTVEIIVGCCMTLKTKITLPRMCEILTQAKGYSVDMGVIYTPYGSAYVEQWNPCSDDFVAMLKVMDITEAEEMEVVHARADASVYI